MCRQKSGVPVGMVSVKLETNSSRAKSISFHPKLPLLLASLHSGELQLWNYENGVLLETLEGHIGPVRGIAFHKSESIFVTGGDDYQVLVWDFKLKCRLFSLTGHTDYVRTVCFHDKHPWILSASDDQTARIWNWQSRTSVHIITGHCHYVMCAAFHPTLDLVLTTSLDHTARLWNVPSANEYILKYVLEGHEKGVNHGTFHPRASEILTCSDDKTVRVWQYSNSKVWCTHILRSHTSNVSSAIYYPQDCSIVISNSEDCTVKFWNVHDWVCKYTYKLKGERFWTLAAPDYPRNDYIAAGHDSGFVLLKLMSKRPLYHHIGGTSMYLLSLSLDLPQEGLINVFHKQPILDFFHITSIDTPKRGFKLRVPSEFLCERLAFDMTTDPLRLLVLSKESKYLVMYYDLPDVTSEQHQIAQPDYPTFVEHKQLIYELLPPQSDPLCACFLDSDKVIVGTAQQLVITNLQFEMITSYPLPTDHLFRTYDGEVFATAQNALYIVKDKPIFILFLTGKAVSLLKSPDGKHYAFACKNSVSILDSRLKLISLIYEERIKSILWDGPAIVLYTTPTHLKFMVLNKNIHDSHFQRSDTGIIRYLGKITYLAYINDNVLGCFTRSTAPTNIEEIKLDNPEYRARHLLISSGGSIADLLSPTPTMGFVGFLKNRGYDDMALQWCKNPSLAFSIAKSQSNITAMLHALELNPDAKTEDWLTLANLAIKQCDPHIAEIAYQKADNTAGLIFLYMLTGQINKLKKIAEIATLSKSHAALSAKLYLQWEPRFPLPSPAGITSRTLLFGLSAGSSDRGVVGGYPEEQPVPKDEEVASHIHPATKSEQKLETDKYEMHPENLTKPTHDSGLRDHYQGRSGRDVGAPPTLEKDEYYSADDSVDKDFTYKEVYPEEQNTNMEVGEVPTSKDGVGGTWEPLPLLCRVYSIKNPVALVPVVTRFYQSSLLHVSPFPNVSPFTIPLHDGIEYLESANKRLLAEAHSLVTGGDFESSIKLYRSILYNRLLIHLEEPDKLCLMPDFVKAKTYIFAMLLELKRAELANKDLAKSLQLALSLTRCSLEASHLFLVLRRTMGIMWKAENYATTADIATRLIKLKDSVNEDELGITNLPGELEKAERILSASRDKARDKYPLDPGQAELCSVSFETFGESDVIECTLCKSKASKEYLGTLCQVCLLCNYGN